MDYYRIPTGNSGKNEYQALPLPFEGFEGSGLESRFLLEAGETGLTLTADAEFASDLACATRPQKGRVFEDDCLELFLRPQISAENPFPAPYYYGWEVNPAGVMLEYRAGIGAEGARMIGSGNGLSVTDGSGARSGVEPVFGILRDEICGVKITFDYDWHSKASAAAEIVRRPKEGAYGLWRLSLAVPWSDLGLTERPRGELWYFTVNRIEQIQGRKPGLATLLSGTETPAFHQPDSFVPLEFGD